MIKNAKLFFSLAVCCSCFLLPLTLMGESNSGVSIEYEEDSTSDYWTGPGWYYGHWFESEPDLHHYIVKHQHHDEENSRGKGQSNSATHQQKHQAPQPKTQHQRKHPQGHKASGGHSHDHESGEKHHQKNEGGSKKP